MAILARAIHGNFERISEDSFYSLFVVPTIFSIEEVSYFCTLLSDLVDEGSVVVGAKSNSQEPDSHLVFVLLDSLLQSVKLFLEFIWAITCTTICEKYHSQIIFMRLAIFDKLANFFENSAKIGATTCFGFLNLFDVSLFIFRLKCCDREFVEVSDEAFEGLVDI